MKTFSLQKRLAAATIATLTVGTSMSLTFMALPSHGLALDNQCSDGIDNDFDGYLDYPYDQDCTSANDNTEGSGVHQGVFVTLTDGKESVAPGGSMIYRIEIGSTGSNESVNVDLQLPAHVSYATASDGGQNVSGNHIRWNGVGVSGNAPRVLTATVNIRENAPEDALLVARVITNGASATDTTRVQGKIIVTGGFTISITDGQQYVEPGTNLTYTVRVRNTRNVPERGDVRVLIPQFTSVVTSSAGSAKIDNNTVIWRDELFGPGEERTYKFTVNVYDRVTERYALRATAYIGNTSAVDQTYTNLGLPDAVLRANISDGRNTVERGQILTYVITIDNVSHDVGIEQYATASLPVYAEFVDATDGGRYDGQNVRWQHLQIAPGGSRKISYSIRVRGDAPIGSELHASVRVEGGFATDKTDVVTRSNERSTPYGQTVDPGVDLRNEGDVLFRKVASSNEIVPGGAVRYTIYVKNTLPYAITDATVSDRFDTQYLSFAEGDVSFREPSRLEWRLPALQPGQEWQTSYVLAVSPSAPREIELTNIATISGRDLQSLSLSERVRTVRTGVIHGMPQTGVPLADLGAYATFFAASLTAGVQVIGRKRWF